MFESILTISLTGFIAGFIFAMPIAGPISILIVSSALNGRLSYSYRISTGAALSDFVYVFLAVFGLTSMYNWYKPAIPYLFIAGAIFFMILAVKVYRSRPDLEKISDKTHLTKRIRKDRNGLYTGFMINMLNPTLFLSGLISSFFVISFIASIGLNTGGFEVLINDTMKQIGTLEGSASANEIFSDKLSQSVTTGVTNHKWYHLVMSVCYAFFISFGGLVWFYLLAWTLVRYRHLIKMRIINFLIRSFGISLGILGLYFGWLGIIRLIESL